MFDLNSELKQLPDKPGVYLMHDKHDEILYVGKALSLHSRVRQYFQTGHGHGGSLKIARMVSQIAWFEYIVTSSEMEALVLECNLIKKYQPKSRSLTSGQVLMRDYEHDEARLVLSEMLDQLCLDMTAK